MLGTWHFLKATWRKYNGYNHRCETSFAYIGMSFWYKSVDYWCILWNTVIRSHALFKRIMPKFSHWVLKIGIIFSEIETLPTNRDIVEAINQDADNHCPWLLYGLWPTLTQSYLYNNFYVHCYNNIYILYQYLHLYMVATLLQQCLHHLKKSNIFTPLHIYNKSIIFTATATLNDRVLTVSTTSTPLQQQLHKTIRASRLSRHVSTFCQQVKFLATFSPDKIGR